MFSQKEVCVVKCFLKGTQKSRHNCHNCHKIAVSLATTTFQL